MERATLVKLAEVMFGVAVAALGLPACESDGGGGGDAAVSGGGSGGAGGSISGGSGGAISGGSVSGGSGGSGGAGGGGSGGAGGGSGGSGGAISGGAISGGTGGSGGAISGGSGGAGGLSGGSGGTGGLSGGTGGGTGGTGGSGGSGVCDCPAVEDPVCGIDGVTYGNACQAECAGVEIIGPDGPCESICAPLACALDCPNGYMLDEVGCPMCQCQPECIFDGDCPMPDAVCVNGYCEGGGCICPAIYQPVCGVDGMTYGNGCEAACAGVEVAAEGECGMGPPR